MYNKTQKVQVLLSTYNGEKYLNDLIASLLNQDYPNLNILIRDDGSTDKTLDILYKYKNIENITLLVGENIGVVNSFFELLKQSDHEADFIAFCDQDDIWLIDKVSRAVKKLNEKNTDKSLMYCSKLTLVDDSLQFLKETISPRKGPAFENSLVQNIATGCTILINKVAREIILLELPKKAIMHDWWIYQVVSAVGEVIYDDESRILYRQHASNVIGAQSTLFGKWKTRISRYLNNKDRYILRNQVMEIDRIFKNNLSIDKRKTIELFINRPSDLKSRLNYVITTKLFRQDIIDDLIFKILILLNRI